MPLPTPKMNSASSAIACSAHFSVCLECTLFSASFCGNLTAHHTMHALPTPARLTVCPWCIEGMLASFVLAVCICVICSRSLYLRICSRSLYLRIAVLSAILFPQSYLRFCSRSLICAFVSAAGPLLRPGNVGLRAQGTLPVVRLAHQAVSGKQPLCQLWRHTLSCRRAIRTIFLIVLNYATRRGVIEHAIQRVRSKRSTRERLPRPCYHERGFPITGFTMESYTLSGMRTYGISHTP